MLTEKTNEKYYDTSKKQIPWRSIDLVYSFDRKLKQTMEEDAKLIDDYLIY